MKFLFPLFLLFSLTVRALPVDYPMEVLEKMGSEVPRPMTIARCDRCSSKGLEIMAGKIAKKDYYLNTGHVALFDYVKYNSDEPFVQPEQAACIRQNSFQILSL